jgi:hypothetical protein
MQNKSRYLTATVTIAIALTTGYVIQNESAVAARFGPEPEFGPLALSQGPGGNLQLPTVTVASAGVFFPQVTRDSEPSFRTRSAAIGLTGTAAIPDLSARTYLPTDEAFAFPLRTPVAAPDRLASLEATHSAPLSDAALGLSPFGTPCEAALSAEARPAAMIHLTLDAACNPYARVTVLHEGLRFTVVTDHIGSAVIDMPALSAPADVSVLFTNGDGASASVDVPDINVFERLVLQWRGASGFQIHALEFGSSYDQDGHVWAGTPRDARFGISGAGGFLTALGDQGVEDALLAEVYTFPPRSVEGGRVDVNIEVEITEANCGREIAGQSLSFDVEGTTDPIDFTFEAPDCSATGDFLVLKYLQRDVKIAGD